MERETRGSPNEDPTFRKLLKHDRSVERRVLWAEIISLVLTAVMILWAFILFRLS